MLKGLPAELLALVAHAVVKKQFAPGELILTTGEAGDGHVFFIAEGYVSILVPLDDGAHQRIASLGPGMSFGEMVLLGQTTRSATVIADHEVECWMLEADEINRLAYDAPRLKIVLLENLSRDMATKLRRATQWIAALA